MAVDDSYTKALLHFDGSNGSTTVTDESGKTWSASGVAQLSTAQKKFGTASALFSDSSAGRIYTANHADFDFGSGNFTIDFWIRPTYLGTNRVIFSKNAGSAYFAPWRIILGSPTLSVLFSTDGASWALTYGPSHGMSINNWYHVAVVRNGTSLLVFVNGTQIGTTQTLSGTLMAETSALSVGSDADGVGLLGAYLDEVRISKGVARWTANFTPPTVQYAGSTYTLTATQTTYNLSGQAATLKSGRALSAAYRALTLSGQAATLKTARKLGITAYTLALTRNPAGFLKGFGLAAAYRALTLSGQAVALKATRTLAAETRMLVFTFSAVTLTAPTIKMTAVCKNLSLSGQAANLIYFYASSWLNVANGLAWALSVDWNNDGVFSDFEPKTIRKLRWKRGRKSRINSSGTGQEHPARESLYVEIYDPEARYDPYNSASPLYAYLGVSGVPMRIVLASQSAPTTILAVFTGSLTNITYDSRSQTAILQGEGLARYLQIGKAESPSTPIQPFGGYDSCFVFGNPLTPIPVNWWRGRSAGLPLSECIDLTLAQSSWPFGVYHGETIYADDQPDYFYLDGSSAWDILKSLADGFAARLFFLRDGRLFGMDRQDRTGLAELAPPGNPLVSYGLERPSPFECIRNRVKIKVNAKNMPPFTAGYSDRMVSVWHSAGPIKVLPGETLYVTAELQLNGKPALASWDYVQAVYLAAWSSPDKTGTNLAGSVVCANLGLDLSDARKIVFYLQNTHATLTAYCFDLDCYALVLESAAGVNTYTAADEASVAMNGPRTLTIDNPWIQGNGMAENVAAAYLAAQADRKKSAPVTLAYTLDGADLYAALRDYDLGTHVDFGAVGGATALLNYGLAGRQLIVGQEVEWSSPSGQMATVKLTYETNQMPPQVGNSISSVGVNATTNGAHAHTVAAGNNRLLVVLVSKRAYNVVSNVTYGGVSMTLLTGENFAAGNYPRYEIWYLLSPAVGTGQVVVTLPGMDWFEVGSVDFSNVDLSNPFGVVTSVNGTISTPAQTITAQNSDVILDFLAIEKRQFPGLTTLTANAGQTERMNASSDLNWSGAASTKPGGLSVSTGWTVSISGRNWIYAVAPIHGR